MKATALFLLLLSCSASAARFPHHNGLWVRGGELSASDLYSFECEKACAAAFAATEAELKKCAADIESGSCVVDFGAKSDALCGAAAQAYSGKVPAAKDAGEQKLLAAKASELESRLDASLRVLYMKQLTLLRDNALARYKAASKDNESSDYEAMVAADAFFGAEAEASARAGWAFAAERSSLQSTMNEIARSKKRLADTKLAAAKSQQEVMRLLQVQHAQIAQLQQVAYGTASPLNLGLAYRVPDTNVNLSLGHQQGRTNVQLSCVPDESSPLLGPNGFTRGVGPGNLGVSVSLTV